MRQLILVGIPLLMLSSANANPPELAESEPPNGATGVKLDIGVIRLHFDRNMKMNSWTLWGSDKGEFPPVEDAEASPWRDPRCAEIKIKTFQPNTTYALQLNSDRRQGFRSAEGDSPLPVTTIVFQTGEEGTGKAVPATKAPTDSLPEPVAEATRRALLIGVSGYEKIPKLRYPAADAKLLDRTLIEGGGFDESGTILMTDDQPEPAKKPTRSNIASQLGTYLRSTGKDHTVLLFFSGHGLKDGSGRAYLAPLDCDPEKMGDTCLPLREIISLLEACSARCKVLILDVCPASPGRRFTIGGRGRTRCQDVTGASGWRETGRAGQLRSRSAQPRE